MSHTTCDMLLHPELLSNQQLIVILEERHLKIPGLHDMSRDYLIELFHNYCVPFAQRRKDASRNKNRSKTEPTPILLTKVDVVCSHKSKVPYTDDYGLKPPPDILAGHMKRIKLGTDLDYKVLSDKSDSAAIKRKNTELDMDIVMGSPPVKKERKPITWP